MDTELELHSLETSEPKDPFVLVLEGYLHKKYKSKDKEKRPVTQNAQSERATGSSKSTAFVPRKDDVSTFRQAMEKAYRRIADLETRIQDLTLQLTRGLKYGDDLSYLERGRRRLEEVFRNRKAEQYAIEAKTTAQWLSAEKYLSLQRHDSDHKMNDVKRELVILKRRELEILKKKVDSRKETAEVQEEVYEEAVKTGASTLLRRMMKNADPSRLQASRAVEAGVSDLLYTKLLAVDARSKTGANQVESVEVIEMNALVFIRRVLSMYEKKNNMHSCSTGSHFLFCSCDVDVELHAEKKQWIRAAYKHGEVMRGKQVSCFQSEKGCTWKGMFGQEYEEHLKECQFVTTLPEKAVVAIPDTPMVGVIQNGGKLISFHLIEDDKLKKALSPHRDPQNETKKDTPKERIEPMEREGAKGIGPLTPPEMGYQQPEMDRQQPEMDRQQPKMDHQQPEMDRQQPEMDRQQPEMDRQQPEMDRQQPEMDRQQPEMDRQQPEMDHQQPKMDRQQSEMDRQQPEMDRQQPEMDRQQPEMGRHQPEMDRHQPEMDCHQPEMDRHQPEMDRQQPEMDHQQPEMDHQQPEMDRHQPEMDRHQTEMDRQQPEMDHQQPEMDRHQPEMDRHQPEMDHHQPEMNRQQPKMDHQQPEMDRQQPEMDCHQPEMDRHQPEMDRQQPEMNRQQPKMDHQQPKMDRQQPEMGRHQPEMDHQQPEMDRQQPEMDRQQPEMDRQQPVMDRQQPEMDRQQPEMDRQQPEMDRQQPEMDRRRPEMDHQQPEMDHRTPEMDRQQLDMDCQQPEMDRQQPKMDHQQPEMDRQQPEMDQKPINMDKTHAAQLIASLALGGGMNKSSSQDIVPKEEAFLKLRELVRTYPEAMDPFLKSLKMKCDSMDGIREVSVGLVQDGQGEMHSTVMRESVLGPKDLSKVYKEIYEVRENWYSIGLELEVPTEVLDHIKSAHPDNAKCLREMLLIWLQRRKGRGPVGESPTWQSLIQALRSPTIEKGGLLADILERKYCRAGGGRLIDGLDGECSTPAVLGRGLDENDLRDLYRELYAIREHWYDLGLELGVSPATLEQIRHDYNDPGSLAECLCEVLRHWLYSRATNKTLRTLCDALQSVIVGKCQLAHRLETLLISNHVSGCDGAEIKCDREEVIALLDELLTPQAPASSPQRPVSRNRSLDEVTADVMPPSAKQMKGHLCEEDLREVRLALWDGRVKWYNIGIELGLHPATLSNIRSENRFNNDASLTEMLTIWLKGLDPKPTWQALVEALWVKTVGEKKLADQIAMTT